MAKKSLEKFSKSRNRLEGNNQTGISKAHRGYCLGKGWRGADEKVAARAEGRAVTVEAQPAAGLELDGRGSREGRGQ